MIRRNIFHINLMAVGFMLTFLAFTLPVQPIAPEVEHDAVEQSAANQEENHEQEESLVRMPDFMLTISQLSLTPELPLLSEISFKMETTVPAIESIGFRPLITYFEHLFHHVISPNAP